MDGGRTDRRTLASASASALASALALALALNEEKQDALRTPISLVWFC